MVKTEFYPIDSIKQNIKSTNTYFKDQDSSFNKWNDPGSLKITTLVYKNKIHQPQNYCTNWGISIKNEHKMLHNL